MEGVRTERAVAAHPGTTDRGAEGAAGRAGSEQPKQGGGKLISARPRKKGQARGCASFPGRLKGAEDRDVPTATQLGR